MTNKNTMLRHLLKEATSEYDKIHRSELVDLLTNYIRTHPNANGKIRKRQVYSYPRLMSLIREDFYMDKTSSTWIRRDKVPTI